MKTYRINKNAERLAQGTGFAPGSIISRLSGFRAVTAAVSRHGHRG